MTFFLPIMHTNKQVFDKMMWNSKYNVYCVQMRPLSGETINANYINKNKKMIFIARPQVKSDIYELYTDINSKEEYKGIAYIDSYKTSIMMNSIFRNIRENNDLDKIEESDDEDEFENTSLDKFIIKKESKILCEYNQSVKGWIPIKKID